MANSSQARKRARQNEKNRRHNSGLRSMLRTYLKKTDAAIQSGEIEAAQAAYVKVVPMLDCVADKGIIHKNKAARHKSRLNTKIKALSAS